MRLGSWDRDGQHIALGGHELDDVRAVLLRAGDHDPVFAVIVPSRLSAAQGSREFSRRVLLSERLPLDGDIHIGGANFWLARLLGCDTTGFGSLEIHLEKIARLPHSNLIGNPAAGA
jgi:hypothetical protein